MLHVHKYCFSIWVRVPGVGVRIPNSLRILYDLSGSKPWTDRDDFEDRERALTMRIPCPQRDRDRYFFSRFNSPSGNLLFIWTDPVCRLNHVRTSSYGYDIFGWMVGWLLVIRRRVFRKWRGGVASFFTSSPPREPSGKRPFGGGYLLAKCCRSLELSLKHQRKLLRQLLVEVTIVVSSPDDFALMRMSLRRVLAKTQELPDGRSWLVLVKLRIIFGWVWAQSRLCYSPGHGDDHD